MIDEKFGIKYEKEINKNDLVIKTPVKSGWYICKIRTRSVGCSTDGYCIATYRPRMLYWESNVWISNPRSFETHDNRDIIDFMPLPEGFDFIEETIKINY